MPSILEIKNLHISFVSENIPVEVVKGISFSLEKGKTLGIVGESGSGKSVSSLAVMQLLPEKVSKITQGEILFAQSETEVKDITKLSAKEMQHIRGNRISMIFQEPMTSLNPVYKCGKQVIEIIRVHKKISAKQAKEQCLALFEEVRLPNPLRVFDSYPHQLSGGQKQRVMIAMALACKPDILIADEPTTALDVSVQKTILELLQSLQEKYGMGIIFISHDLGVIAKIAQKVAVLYKGEVVEQGLVTDVFNNPQHPYTKGLLACRPVLGKRPLRLQTVSDFLNNTHTENNKEESSAERESRHKILYAQNPVLQIKNVVVSYPLAKTWWGKTTSTLNAVNNVSFNVYEGETLGLVGESGCGKTTLGRTILQLIHNQSGDIAYKEHLLNKMKESELKKLRSEMQIIFQDPYSSLNPRITIGNAIMEPLAVHTKNKTPRQQKQLVIELMEKVGLEERQFNRYPHEFSGGQRQRICIARALILNPKLVICDESVSALDVSVQAQVLNLLNDLKRELNLTYIFISHDLSVVKYMSDRMLVMQQGNIVEMGDADNIYHNPASEYTRKLIDAIPQ